MDDTLELDAVIGSEKTRHLRPNRQAVVVMERDSVRAMFCGKHANEEAAAYIAQMADTPYVRIM